MAKTKTEKLLDRKGQLIECEVCRRQKLFIGPWMMTAPDKVVVCPDCLPGIIKSGKTLVNI